MKNVILHVEDEISHALLVKNCLNEFKDKIQYIHLLDGDDVLKYLSDINKNGIEKNPMPNLILLDFNLPKISGIEVLKSIKSNDKLKYIPVIIFSTSISFDDIVNAYKHGVNGYVEKSVNFTQLYETLHSVINYWMNCNIIPIYFNI